MQPGVYRHYKGGYYTVLMTAVSADNADDRADMVVYVSHTTGQLYTRSLAEFRDCVRDGKRFEYVGPHLGAIRRTEAPDSGPASE
jgi:hypothetical protein